MKTEQVMPNLIGKTYKEVVEALSVDSWDGDCCGWSDCEVSDMVKDIEGASEARLKHVVKIDYEEDEGDRVVVNFIFGIGGGDGVILGYDMSAGSGSGWAYGAGCRLMYGDEEVAGACY